MLHLVAAAVFQILNRARRTHLLDLWRLLIAGLIAGIVAEFPKRYVGLGTLPMQAIDLAVQELERCVNDLKLAGVEIGTHVNGANLNEPMFFPLYEAAQDLGAAIFVHPWDILAQERMKKYWLSWLYPSGGGRLALTSVFEIAA
jgi:aminocarboxymuconate-semialdehyde decarboxylase